MSFKQTNIYIYIIIYIYLQYIYICIYLLNKSRILVKVFSTSFSYQALVEWTRLRRPSWASWICKQIPKRFAPCPISQHVSRTAKKREPKPDNTRFKLCTLVWKKTFTETEGKLRMLGSDFHNWLFMFTNILDGWINDPLWLVCLRWVETTT